MFHTFFSQIVKQQAELDKSGSLPRTPASARRIQPVSGSGSLNRRSQAMSPPPEIIIETNQQNPSQEQQAVISRLGN